MICLLSAIADIATIATAAVAVWFWVSHYRRTQGTADALEQLLRDKAKNPHDNSLELIQLMAALNASAAEVREAVARKSGIVESFEGLNKEHRFRIKATS